VKYLAKELFSKSKIIVDIGTTRIKVIEVSYGARKIKVNKAYVLKDASKFFKNRDLTNLSSLAEVLIRSFKENGIKTNKISLLFSSPSVAVKIIKSPLMAQREMKLHAEQLIVSEFGEGKQLTHISDWSDFGDVYEESETYTPLLITSASKLVIQSVVLEFTKRKYKITEIDTYATSLYYLSTLYDSEYENPTKAFVDVGNASTKITVTHRGQPIFFREFTNGLGTLINDISAEITFPTGRVGEYIRRIGLDKNYFSHDVDAIFDKAGIVDDDYMDAVDEAFIAYLKELNRCITHCSQILHTPINNIILLGGTPLLKGFSSKLSGLTNIQTENWELMSSIAGDKVTIINNTDKTIDSSFGPCVGLAIKGVL